MARRHEPVCVTEQEEEGGGGGEMRVDTGYTRAAIILACREACVWG